MLGIGSVYNAILHSCVTELDMLGVGGNLPNVPSK